MTATPVYFAPELKGLVTQLSVGDSLSLTEKVTSDFKHLLVARHTANDSISLTDGKGFRAEFVIVNVAKSEIVLRLLSAEKLPESRFHISLVQAMLKNKRDELAVEMCTELGVQTFIPWEAEHSIVRLASAKSSDKLRERWQLKALSAMKQSRQSYLPKVAQPQSTSGLLEHLQNAAITSPKKPLLVALHNTATKSLTTYLNENINLEHSSDIYVITGPEGGISESEMKQFLALGAVPCLLTDTILRSATASVVAVSLCTQTLNAHD